MPRKSSFLMGFETGADLYHRGYSQAMSLAQMKQQQEERKYQRGRDEKEDRLAQDLANQRKKRFEMELAQYKAQQKERARKLDDKKLAFGRFEAFRSFVKEVNLKMSGACMKS